MAVFPRRNQGLRGGWTRRDQQLRKKSPDAVFGPIVGFVRGVGWVG